MEETSGAVQNLTEDLDDYGFDWKLIGWKTSDLFAGVPFVGYAVRNQRDLPKPADDLTAEYTSENDGKVTLTWTSPELETGRMEITHFVIWQDGEKVKIVSNTGAGSPHTTEIDVSQYTNNSATYAVSSYREIDGGASGYMGIPSNEVFIAFSLTPQEIENLIADAKTEMQEQIDALNTQLAEQGTANAESINNLIAAYKEADALLNSELAAQSDQLAELQQTTTEADAALQTAIDKVNADLTAAIDEVRNATDESMEQAVADLTDAYTSADLLMKSDIASLQDKLTALQDLMKQSDELTGKKIEQVQDDLEEVRNELTENMTTDFETINNRIDTISSTLDAASSMADSALQNNIDAANATVEEVISVHKKDIELLQNELDVLRQELKDLQKQVETQEQTDTDHMEEIRSTQTITYVSLGVGTVSLAGNVALLLAVARKLSLFK